MREAIARERCGISHFDLFGRQERCRAEALVSRLGWNARDGKAPRAWLLLSSVATFAAGCGPSHAAPETPCTVSVVTKNQSLLLLDEVDLLFVVDDSRAMQDAQRNLRQAFPDLVHALATGEITDPATGAVTGVFPAVRSLHVGVVTSDMGSDGLMVPTCGNGDMGYTFGDDGILRTTGDPANAACAATYPKFLTYWSGAMGPEGDPAALVQDFDCVSAVGTDGCGFAQPLEAALAALTPSSSPILFFEGTVGRGDTLDAGFLRSGSLLVVVLVTDGDDCTAKDPALFDPDTSNPTYPGPLPLRCATFPDAQQPPSRYVDGLLALRPGEPNLLLYDVIAGVPPDLLGDPYNIDYDAILADPRMQDTPDPAHPTELAPSCRGPGSDVSYPPRRIVKVSQGLYDQGLRTALQSSCAGDYGPAMNALAERIADALGRPTCLPRPVPLRPDGHVGCDLVEVLPAAESGHDVTRCAQLADAGVDPTPVRTEVDGESTHQVCRLRQVVPLQHGGGCDPTVAGSCPSGWYYDDFSARASALPGRSATHRLRGRRRTTGRHPH